MREAAGHAPVCAWARGHSGTEPMLARKPLGSWITERVSQGEFAGRVSVMRVALLAPAVASACVSSTVGAKSVAQFSSIRMLEPSTASA